MKTNKTKNTTKKLQRWATRTPHNNRSRTKVLPTGKQLGLLIRHSPYYSYGQVR